MNPNASQGDASAHAARIARFAAFIESAKKSIRSNQVYSYYNKEQTPYFDQEVFDELPDRIRGVMEAFEQERERDISFLSTLVSIGALFPYVSGEYSHERLYPNLYLYVVAKAASGKGVLNLVRPLVKAYCNKTEKQLIVPGNSSASALINQLKENDGLGIVIEPESDTILYTMKQEWGDFSDIYRKGFHHESISKSRVDNKRKGNFMLDEVDCPKITLLISSTPEAYKKLIQSSENGLASRFMHYTFEDATEWKNVRPSGQQNSPLVQYKKMEVWIMKLVENYGTTEVKFVFSEKQWNSFHKFFEQILSISQLKDGDNYTDMVKRCGPVFFRLVMILTILRNEEPQEEMECSDGDFEIGKSMIVTILQHNYFCMVSLPEKDSKSQDPISGKKSSAQALYDLMDFDKGYEPNELLMLAQKRLNVKERACYNYIKILRTTGLIHQPIGSKLWFNVIDGKTCNGTVENMDINKSNTTVTTVQTVHDVQSVQRHYAREFNSHTDEPDTEPDSEEEEETEYESEPEQKDEELF